MDDSHALIGLLDRLAKVRQAGAFATRPMPRADMGNEEVLERGPLGAVAVRRDGLRAVHGSAGRLPLRLQLNQRQFALADARIRGTFALVNEFRAALESKADPHWLGILLHAVTQDAASTFDVAAKVRPETPEFGADKARCLSDLQKMLCGVRGEDPPTGYELTHAMDALIVQLVQLTG